MKVAQLDNLHLINGGFLKLSGDIETVTDSLMPPPNNFNLKK